MTDRRRLLGLDVGTVRIGVAVSDELGIIATPLKFVVRGPQDRAAFRKLVDRYQIGGLVAGIPRGLSGREGPQAQDVRGYTDTLARELDLPLVYWDERLTTVIAERSLITGGRSRQQRKSEVDSAAAAVMLQGYLDRQASQRRTEPV
jgi:putative holliday junction resolvase